MVYFTNIEWLIIVTDYSSSGNNNSNIYSSQLVKSDNKLIEVCFTKKISDNSNVDKNDFTIKTDGVSNDIVSVSKTVVECHVLQLQIICKWIYNTINLYEK